MNNEKMATIINHDVFEKEAFRKEILCQVKVKVFRIFGTEALTKATGILGQL